MKGEGGSDLGILGPLHSCYKKPNAQTNISLDLNTICRSSRTVALGRSWPLSPPRGSDGAATQASLALTATPVDRHGVQQRRKGRSGDDPPGAVTH